MGAVKQWLIERAEDERREEWREWFRDKYGRQPRDGDWAGTWDEFEMDEALNIAEND